MTPVADTGADQSWPSDLVAAVRNLPEHARLVVALSGGLDSVVLLNLAIFVHGREQVSAIHVNHGLQANARDMEHLCRQACDRLGVRLNVHRLERPAAEQNLAVEEWARNGRYGIFRNTLEAGELLLMAHHADDQAETVLFRLLRGSGPRGLAGIPVRRPLGKGTLYRPLLPFSRADLEALANQHSLAWVEDPSNEDQRFDRNFLRHGIMPLLRKRWPSLSRRLEHTARACSESALLADRLADLQLSTLGNEDGTLDLDRFAGLVLAEQKNLLRRWVEIRGFQLPAVGNWSEVIGQFLSAGSDREPELQASGFSLRRYQGKLYLVPDSEFLPDGQFLGPDSPVGWNGWQLRLQPVAGQNHPCPSIRVTARAGGEKLRPRDGGPSRPLSKWLQEQQVPPWERERLPLLYLTSGTSEHLVAVGDLWQSPDFSGRAPGSGWRIVIEKDSN